MSNVSRLPTTGDAAQGEASQGTQDPSRLLEETGDLQEDTKGGQHAAVATSIGLGSQHGGHRQRRRSVRAPQESQANSVANILIARTNTLRFSPDPR